jgi:hypothetical protein
LPRPAPGCLVDVTRQRTSAIPVPRVTELPTCNLLIGAHRPEWKFRRVGRTGVRPVLPVAKAAPFPVAAACETSIPVAQRDFGVLGQRSTAAW